MEAKEQRRNLPIELWEHNRNDKAYLNSGLIDAMLNGWRNELQRESYLHGKEVGFRIGSDAYRPNRIDYYVGNNQLTQHQADFHELLLLIQSRFGISIVYHPNQGMILTDSEQYPDEHDKGLFHTLDEKGDIKVMSRKDLLRKLHLQIEQMSDREISQLSLSMTYSSKDKEIEPCPQCGKSIREQKQGCNEITCYRQHLKH